MSYTIIIDSSAQLPESFKEQRPITVLPVTVKLNGEVFEKYCCEDTLTDLYRHTEIEVDTKFSSTPIEGEDLTNFMLEKIVPYYDTAICQTVSQKYSSTYGNYKKSINSILVKSVKRRHELGLHRPFRMTYTSTGNASSGQGLVAAYADSLLIDGCEYNQYKSKIELFKEFVKTYTTIKDMVYGRHKAKQRGSPVVSYATARIMNATGVVPIVCNNDGKVWMSSSQRKFANAVNRICAYAIDRIKEGLYFDTIIVSIADNVGELDNFSEFLKLKSIAEVEGVTVLVNVMTLAVAINFGQGTFALGIAPINTMIEP